MKPAKDIDATRPRRRRIFIVDDDWSVRRGLSQLINYESDMRVCGEAETAQRAFEGIARLQPDLAIVDLSLKGSNGLELIGKLKDRFPDFPVVVLSMHEASLLALPAMQAGARGYVMKQDGAERILDAVRDVLAGRRHVNMQP
jgi:DNA-binding NarL/FixJ family response regulator